MALLVTDAGQNWVVDLINDKSDGGARATGAWEWGAWGTGGATVEAFTDTLLVAEAAEARVEATTTQPTPDTLRLVFAITATTNRAINEAGAFNISAKGGGGQVLLNRGTFPVLNLESGDVIEFTFDNRCKGTGEA